MCGIRKKDVLLQRLFGDSSFNSWGSRIVAIATDCKSVRESVRWFESTLPHENDGGDEPLFLCAKQGLTIFYNILINRLLQKNS